MEIERLRQRLKNVGRNTTEYRMTVVEARNLLAEIDKLLVPAEVKTVIEKPVEVSKAKIIDGGTF